MTFWAGDWCADKMTLDDEELTAEMLGSLAQLLPEVTDLVEFVVIDRWSPSNPDLRPGNHRLHAELARITDSGDRVQLAGDYTGMPLIEGCAISGRDAAHRLANAIGGPTGQNTHK